MVQNKSTKWILLAVNCVVALCIVLPILYAFSVSLMTPSEIFQYPPRLLPSGLYTQNYTDALRMAPIFRFILNSLFVATVVTIGQLFTGALAAYAFSILEFKGKKAIFMLMLCTMMIPSQAIIIANYLTISGLGMTDSYQALILPYLTSAFCVFNMRQAFLQLPTELNEAAKIDGCSTFRFFISIALPLTKPSLGALGVYTFLQSWNQYLWPLLVTDSKEYRTVQIGMGMLQNAEGNAFGPIRAGVIMVLAPSILAFILGQKQLVAGLTAGAVKG